MLPRPLPAAELEEKTSTAKKELEQLRSQNQELLQRLEVKGFKEPKKATDKYGIMGTWECGNGIVGTGIVEVELMVCGCSAVFMETWRTELWDMEV